jgi:hypothetical protein
LDIITEVAGLGVTDFWLDHVNFPVHGRQERINYDFDQPRPELLAGFLESARVLVRGFGGVLWVSADLSLFLPEGGEPPLFAAVGGQSLARFSGIADRLVADLRTHAAGFGETTGALAAQHRDTGLPFLPYAAYRPLEADHAPDAARLNALLDAVSYGRSWGYIIKAEGYPAGAFHPTAG